MTVQLLSPYAPNYDWLHARVEPWAPMIHSGDSDEEPALNAWAKPGELLDLRHGPTRYSVIRAFHQGALDLQWALGSPFSNLSDEQAGRVVAYALSVMGEVWDSNGHGQPRLVLGIWRDWGSAGCRPQYKSCAREVIAGSGPSWSVMVKRHVRVEDLLAMDPPPDALLWEQITPDNKDEVEPLQNLPRGLSSKNGA